MGVPFTHEVWDSASPSFDVPLESHLFDSIRDWTPQDEGTLGDALLRIKVCDFTDGQVVALSATHGLTDARSLGMILEAWAAAFRGEDLPLVTYDRSGSPSTPSSGQPPLYSADDVPDEWQALHQLRDCTAPSEPYEPCIGTCRLSAKACADLKQKYNARSTTLMLSTNDVLCGEIARAVGKNKVGIAVNLRETLFRADFFGNAFASVGIFPEVVDDVPGALRDAMPVVRDPRFLRWKIGQGHGAADVIVNSWVRAFDFAQVHFKSSLQDICLSKAMLVTRGALFGPRGLHYAIVLKQCDGVKIHLISRADSVTNLETARRTERWS